MFSTYTSRDTSSLWPVYAEPTSAGLSRPPPFRNRPKRTEFLSTVGPSGDVRSLAEVALRTIASAWGGISNLGNHRLGTTCLPCPPSAVQHIQYSIAVCLGHGVECEMHSLVMGPRLASPAFADGMAVLLREVRCPAGAKAKGRKRSSCGYIRRAWEEVLCTGMYRTVRRGFPYNTDGPTCSGLSVGRVEVQGLVILPLIFSSHPFFPQWLCRRHRRHGGRAVQVFRHSRSLRALFIWIVSWPGFSLLRPIRFPFGPHHRKRTEMPRFKSI